MESLNLKNSEQFDSFEWNINVKNTHNFELAKKWSVFFNPPVVYI